MSEISPTTNAGSLQLDFMNLMVTQLRNQNPLEPVDNQQMAAQLAQFSSLQQLESLNKNFSQVLEKVEDTYANSLIGKEISFMVRRDDNTSQLVSGVVDGVCKIDGQKLLVVGQYTPTIEDVITVKN